MSYDVQVWTARRGELRSLLPDPGRWKGEDGSAVWEASSWQITVSGPVSVESEDVPVDVAVVLPGASFLYELSLEPIGAPRSAHARLLRVAKAIAAGAHGAVLDPQTDEVSLPSGVRRFQRPQIEEEISLLQMTWLFTASPILEPDGAERLISMLDQVLPEALPRRYGEYEPPQHKFAETGREHFVRFLTEKRFGGAWSPSRPVVDVSGGADNEWGWERRGFRANYLAVALEAAALEQPGWAAQLQRAWRGLAKLLRPFYGDVRTLGGWKMSRNGTLWADGRAEDHPVKAWWWEGIPPTLGHAAVLGPEYGKLWPEFVRHAEQEDGLAFISADEWRGEDDVSTAIGGVPPEIRIQDSSSSDVGWGIVLPEDVVYPPSWPFEPRPGPSDSS